VHQRAYPRPLQLTYETPPRVRPGGDTYPRRMVHDHEVAHSRGAGEHGIQERIYSTQRLPWSFCAPGRAQPSQASCEYEVTGGYDGHTDNDQGATESCEEGPFWTEDMQDVPSGGDLAVPGTLGEKLVFQGTVKNLKGEPVKGAKAEVWQADGDGFYDIQYPDRKTPNDRGRVIARDDGTMMVSRITT
jgi:hypothetical protein